jgi:pSer/pThr/pTyr-binding forkhead associated (FHA) protein
MLYGAPQNRPVPFAGWSLQLTSGPGAPQALALDGSVIIIGRAPGCAVYLPADGRVSRQHAQLRYEEGAWVVEDLGSANGTFVGRERVLGPTPLRPGDEIRMGQTALVLDNAERAAPPEAGGAELVGLDTQVGEGEGPNTLALRIALASLREDPEEPAPLDLPPPPLDLPLPPPEGPPALAGGDAFLAWTGDGLGARLWFPERGGPTSEQVRAALAGLRPPAQVTVLLTETLGQPGPSLSLQALPGGQPQLLQCAGEMLCRLKTEDLRLQTLAS